jgi:DNA-directed RNA polymerase subunit RPC12/RpoP
MSKTCSKCKKKIGFLEDHTKKGSKVTCINCNIKRIHKKTDVKIYSHPQGDVEIHKGFNFTALLLGPFWFLIKKMFGAALLTFFLTAVVIAIFGLRELIILWVFIGFLANEKYEKFLLEKGYKLKKS